MRIFTGLVVFLGALLQKIAKYISPGVSTVNNCHVGGGKYIV